MNSVDTNTLVRAEGEGVCASCKGKISAGETKLVLVDASSTVSICDCCVVKEMINMDMQQFNRCIIYERAKVQIVERELARALSYSFLHRKRGLDEEGK
jgi:hypothetical protein